MFIYRHSKLALTAIGAILIAMLFVVPVLATESSTSIQLEKRGLKDVDTEYDSYANLSTDYNRVYPSAGLWIWTGIGRAMRESFKQGGSFPIDETKAAANKTPINAGKVVKYYVPLIIFCGFMLILIVATLVYGSLMCCCCHRRILRARSSISFNIKTTIICSAISLFIFFATVVCVICGSRSAALSRNSVDTVLDNVNDSFVGVESLLDAYSVNVEDVMDGAGDDVGMFSSTIMSLASVPDILTGEALFSSVSSTLSSATLYEAEMTSYASSYDVSVTSISPSLAVATLAVTSVNTVVTGPFTVTLNSNTYTVTVSAGATGSFLLTVPTEFASTTDLTNTISNDVTAGFDDTAISTAIVQAAASGSIYGFITPTVVSIASNIYSTATSTFDSIQTQAEASLSPISSKVEKLHSKVKRYANDVNKYQKVVEAVAIVFLCIPAILLILMIIGVFIGNYRVIRIGVYISSGFTIIAFILAILTAILTSAASQVCELAFDNSKGDPIFVEYSTAFFGSGFSYGELYEFRSKCLASQDISLYEAVNGTFGIVPNITEEAYDYVMNSIPLSSLTTLTLSKIASYTYLTPVISSATAFQPHISAQATAVSNIAVGASNIYASVRAASTAAASLTSNQIGPVTGAIADADMDGVVRYVSSALASAFSSMSTVASNALNVADAVNTVSQELLESSNNYVNLITWADNAGTTAVTDFNEGVDDFNDGLHHTVPAAQVQLANNIAVTANGLYGNNTYCYPLAVDFVTLEVGFCDGFQSSIDGLFFCFFILATVGLLSLPFLVTMVKALESENVAVFAGRSEPSYTRKEEPPAWKSPIVADKSLTIKNNTDKTSTEKPIEGASFVHTAVMDDEEEDNGNQTGPRKLVVQEAPEEEPLVPDNRRTAFDDMDEDGSKNDTPRSSKGESALGTSAESSAYEGPAMPRVAPKAAGPRPFSYIAPLNSQLSALASTVAEQQQQSEDEESEIGTSRSGTSRSETSRSETSRSE